MWLKDLATALLSFLRAPKSIMTNLSKRSMASATPKSQGSWTNTIQVRSTGADLSDEQAIQKALRAASWELRYTVEDWKDSEIEVGVFRLIRGLSHPDILRYNSLDNWRRIHPIDCLWKKLDTYTAQSEDEAHKWANENYPDAIFDPMSGA